MLTPPCKLQWTASVLLPHMVDELNRADREIGTKRVEFTNLYIGPHSPARRSAQGADGDDDNYGHPLWVAVGLRRPASKDEIDFVCKRRMEARNPFARKKWARRRSFTATRAPARGPVASAAYSTYAHKSVFRYELVVGRCGLIARLCN